VALNLKIGNAMIAVTNPKNEDLTSKALDKTTIKMDGYCTPCF
jgi:hypothetical protein